MQHRSDRKHAEAAPEALEQARRCFGQRAWGKAYLGFAAADAALALGAQDLERLATAAYLTGREAEFERHLARACGGYLQTAEPLRAARCCFWLGLRLLLVGKGGPASGWLARGGRLVDGRDCAEAGYLLVPRAERQLAEGDAQAAQQSAQQAAAIGERLGDPDLLACARHQQGRALIAGGEVQPGLALLDEAMLTVVGDTLSPIMTGLVYCSVIEACQKVCAFARARDWTEAMARWCAQQPELVAFSATCLVHRAEIQQLHGAWPDAMATVSRACPGAGGSADGQASGSALYRRAELHRLRGEVSEAEACYGGAGKLGREPQPGLALLRVAQGDTAAALAGVRRALAETADLPGRAHLLAALVEILIRADAVPQALNAACELQAIAQRYRTEALEAMAGQARGACALAAGDTQGALTALRRAFQDWQAVGAPYEAARVRALIGQACQALGDEDAARLEREAALAVFEQLGARPDLEPLRALAGTSRRRAHRLTPRELQVLRLLAAGKTNKAIALELGLSNRTVDRHVANILDKLDVPSRAAATAYACRHQLVAG